MISVCAGRPSAEVFSDDRLPPGTNVRVAVESEDGIVRLAVSDDGPGIDLIGEIKSVVFRVVNLLRNRNLCERAILLLKLPPQAL